MKKLLCVLAVIALTAPLYAGDVTITASSPDATLLQIGYTVTSGTDVPVGISFVVSCDNGARVASVVSYDSENFNTTPDEASEDPCAYTLGAGNPVAQTDAAGIEALPASPVSICMGALYADPCAAPGTVSNLITLQLDDPCGAGSCDVTISADTLRGEVQGAEEFNVTYPGPTNVLFDCYTASDKSVWDAVGKPACWCFPNQCYGDADGTLQGSLLTGYWAVGSDDLAILYSAWQIKDTTGQPPGTQLDSTQICADFNHARQGSLLTGYWRVGSDDLAIMYANWQKITTATNAPPGDCMSQ